MHQYFHTTLGFCLWDVLALIVLVVIVAVLAVHIYRQKKRQNEFEDELAGQKSETSSGRGSSNV